MEWWRRTFASVAEAQQTLQESGAWTPPETAAAHGLAVLREFICSRWPTETPAAEAKFAAERVEESLEAVRRCCSSDVSSCPVASANLLEDLRRDVSTTRSCLHHSLNRIALLMRIVLAAEDTLERTQEQAVAVVLRRIITSAREAAHASFVTIVPTKLDDIQPIICKLRTAATAQKRCRAACDFPPLTYLPLASVIPKASALEMLHLKKFFQDNEERSINFSLSPAPAAAHDRWNPNSVIAQLWDDELAPSDGAEKTMALKQRRL